MAYIKNHLRSLGIRLFIALSILSVVSLSIGDEGESLPVAPPTVNSETKPSLSKAEYTECISSLSEIKAQVALSKNRTLVNKDIKLQKNPENLAKEASLKVREDARTFWLDIASKLNKCGKVVAYSYGHCSFNGD